MISPLTIIDPFALPRPSTPDQVSRTGGGRPAAVAVPDVDGTLIRVGDDHAAGTGRGV